MDFPEAGGRLAEESEFWGVDGIEEGEWSPAHYKNACKVRVVEELHIVETFKARPFTGLLAVSGNVKFRQLLATLVAGKK